MTESSKERIASTSLAPSALASAVLAPSVLEIVGATGACAADLLRFGRLTRRFARLAGSLANPIGKHLGRAHPALAACH
ncbi:MAG: hypothetical protein ABI589_03260 [Burkholderiales bacterium]